MSLSPKKGELRATISFNQAINMHSSEQVTFFVAPCLGEILSIISTLSFIFIVVSMCIFKILIKNS
jgi:hypothetical protein